MCLASFIQLASLNLRLASLAKFCLVCQCTALHCTAETSCDTFKQTLDWGHILFKNCDIYWKPPLAQKQNLIRFPKLTSAKQHNWRNVSPPLRCRWARVSSGGSPTDQMTCSIGEEWLVRNFLLWKMSTFVGRSVGGSHRRRRGRGRSFSSAAPPPPPPPPPLPPYPCSPAKEVNLICHHQNGSLLKSHSDNPHPPQRLCIPSIIMLHYFLRPPSLWILIYVYGHLLLPPAAALPPPPPPPQVVLVHVDQGEEGGAGEHEGSRKVVAGSRTRPCRSFDQSGDFLIIPWKPNEIIIWGGKHLLWYMWWAGDRVWALWGVGLWSKPKTGPWKPTKILWLYLPWYRW